MNAHEHFAEAERLIHANRPRGGAPPLGGPQAKEIALAQVHATLALTAITAEGAGTRLGESQNVKHRTGE